MKRGRYNIELPSGEIKKFNVYQSEDNSELFIYYKKTYQMVKRFKRYKSGWLWKLAEKGIV